MLNMYKSKINPYLVKIVTNTTSFRKKKTYIWQHLQSLLDKFFGESPLYE